MFLLRKNFHLHDQKNRNNLVPIDKKTYDVIFDIRYATQSNFTHKKVYTNADADKEVFLHKDAAKKLLVAIQYAAKLGYKIKIFDAFRPLYAQAELYNSFNDDRYVSNPKTGVAAHTRGVAIDLTLVDTKTGKELDMGTEFDSFEERAHHTPNIDANVLKNRLLLAGIMSIAGFTPISTEWWHYNLRLYQGYPDYKDYPKMD